MPVDSDDEITLVQEAAKDRSRFIEVHTDVLQFAIDLEGGDIVELSLRKYLAELDDPGQPLVLLEENKALVYIAQSGLIGADGIDNNGRAMYTSTSSKYRLEDNEDTLLVDLNWQTNSDIKVTKRYTLQRGEYLMDVQYLVENNSDERWQANLFGQIKRGNAPVPSASDNYAWGCSRSSVSRSPDPRSASPSSPLKIFRKILSKRKLPGGWIAMIQHYFLSAWIPRGGPISHLQRASDHLAASTSPASPARHSRLIPVKAEKPSARFYAGPKDQYRLEEISPYLDLSVDYGWLWWIAQPLFWLLTQIQAVVVNWGVAIILLTVLIKAAFFKLSATSYRSMARMRAVQPKLVAIREQHADDKAKQSQAMMDLYKKEKINPMGGCLPILVQMPVFIGLYWMLMESVELRHAPFILWIHDLSVMDPYFVLPLLMGASMFFMQKLNPPPPDPMQAKIMQWMPVMFTFFFLWFPAGSGAVLAGQ